MSRWDLQDSEYEFPYHHVPVFGPDGLHSAVRQAKWGFGYACQLLHVRDLVLQAKPASLLDVGCGDGRFTALMANDLPVVKGVDLSERAIAHAHALVPHADTAVQDAATVSDSYDAVVAIETLEHIPDEQIQSFVGSLADRLNPGGQVVITVPSDNKPVAPKHYRHYNADLLKQQVTGSRPDLELISVTYLNRIWLPMRILLGLMYNSIWTIEIRPLTRLFWRFYWAKLRLAGQNDGTNVVGVFRKRVDG